MLNLHTDCCWPGAGPLEGLGWDKGGCTPAGPRAGRCCLGILGILPRWAMWLTLWPKCRLLSGHQSPAVPHEAQAPGCGCLIASHTSFPLPLPFPPGTLNLSLLCSWWDIETLACFQSHPQPLTKNYCSAFRRVSQLFQNEIQQP